MIGVIGGSFNPITIGHLLLGESLINKLELSNIIYVPVSDKYNKKGLINSKYRVDMLKESIKDNDKFILDLIEVENTDRQLRTVETLELLSEKYDEQLALIIGVDNLYYIPKWYRKRDLLSKFKIIVCMRNGISKQEVSEYINCNKVLKNFKDNIIIVDTLNNDISSTIVRNNIKDSKSIKYLVLDEVERYIVKNNLYS